MPGAWFAKGNYFTLAGRAPFSAADLSGARSPGGLGVHLTLDLAGQARFGPDVEWVDGARLHASIRRGRRGSTRHPALLAGRSRRRALAWLCGMRPKLSGPGEPAADFRIDGPAEHGIEGLINLFGIESPGLTASLALADAVLEIVRGG